MNRILVLSELYYPEEQSTGYLLTRTAEGLAATAQVRVVTGPASSFSIHQAAPDHEVRNGVEIFRCPGTRLSNDRLAFRLVNMATRSLAMLWRLLRVATPGETVLVVTNPPLLPFIALLVKWVKGNPFVLLIHDVYPEALIAAGIAGPRSMLVRCGAVLNKLLYRNAIRIVTLGRDMRRLVWLKLGNEDPKVECIPNWADTDIVRPLDRSENSLASELTLKNEFVVLYAGNIGRTHGIEMLAEAARQLRDSNVCFVVLGFGARKPWLEAYVKEHDLRNMHILPPRPRSDQILFLNLADVALIPFVSGMSGISVPSRMYNQMAAGKPLLAVCDQSSELALVVNEEKIGWVIPPGDIPALVNAIKLASANPEVCREMGKRAADVASTKYPFKSAIRAYEDLFRSVQPADGSNPQATRPISALEEPAGKVNR